MKLLLLFILILLMIIILKKHQSEQFILEYVQRDLLENAKCISGDLELDTSYFMCQMDKKYSPININVFIVKYQNFSPYVKEISTPSTSFNLLSTLTPNLTSPPLFSNDDFLLIGTNINPVTNEVTLNDYTKLMKVINYSSPNLLLFDPLPIVNPVTSSLDDNNFLYLPDSIVNYVKYLKDLNILMDHIDVNKIDTLPNIAKQFNLYLSGLLVPIIKPPTDKFRIQREIIVIFDNPSKKNIVNVQFNEIITWYDTDNIEHNDKITKNINTMYDYLVINSYVDYKLNNTNYTGFITPIINKINTYGNYLKIRKLIDDYHLEDLLEKINNLDSHNILYVNYYYNESTFDFGIQLVKRVNGNLIFMNYFDVVLSDNNIPFSYYKNICSDFAYKGRCYSNCPNGYSSMGLVCVHNSKKDSLFDPDSNYCKQVCDVSETDIRNFDPILQKACWCKSMSCNKCSEFSIGNCTC